MGAVSPEARQAARRALGLSDGQLLRECFEEFFVASGPGGQHRNKTASGVRLTHVRSGVSVTATERRSQLRNRHAALERLRERLAQLARVPKPRRTTRPPRSAAEHRLTEKKRRSEKKAMRSPPRV